jgi:hypothetical protein
MQRGSCEVRLGGDLLNTVILTSVSPAEVAILRHIHGSDAVVNLRQHGNDQGKAVDEKSVLSQRYARAYKEVFPGQSPQLPNTFADIGIDFTADDEQVQPRGKERVRKAKSEAESGPAEVTAADLTAE